MTIKSIEHGSLTVCRYGTEQIGDYQFLDDSGQSVTLQSLFGEKEDLIVIHNMGKGCSYCTMWADGFNGMRHHLQDRAVFVLVSPDAPEVLKEFAESRDWRFRVLSNDGGSLYQRYGLRIGRGESSSGNVNFSP